MAEVSYSAHRARLLVRDHLARELSARRSACPGIPPPGEVPWDRYTLPEDNQPHQSSPQGPKKICIVGAGMAGLYVAFILEKLAIPGVSYDILEASTRVGGRAFTYSFSNEKHDYYDVGAMRFPKNKVMDRFFTFCKDTGTQTVPYYYSDKAVNCTMLFNDILIPKPVKWETDPFGICKASSIKPVDPDTILKSVMKPYIDAIKEDQTKGFEKLMEVDEYSTGEYLRQKTQYKNPGMIEYLEAFGGTTDLFTGAFSEEVIQMIDFTTPDWECIEGGTSVLANNATKKLKTKPQLNKRVTSISLIGQQNAIISQSLPPSQDPLKFMLVQVAGEMKPREYSTVICTTTLSCAQRIDLRKAKLSWGQKTAIRALNYAPATKVAIKFSRAWWIKDCKITTGGISSSDEPLRNCVYPSYNIHDSPDEPAVLLCSYTWTQDAFRLGSLVRRESPKGEDELRECMLQGLARMHKNHNITYETLNSLYITHHAYDWYQTPYASGACAGFRPGQFSQLYPHLTRPAAEGNLIFAGEAMSAHHAWIVGALESAWRAVYQFLCKFGMVKEIDELIKQFGNVPEVETGKSGTAHLQVLLGRFPQDE